LRYIEIEAVDFMRGASLSRVILIIDEAQNLTPHQVKSLVTRAGEGTRVILLGDTSQIDSPYLDEGSSGLTYAVERFREWEGSGHILLRDGERSRLATYAASVL
jgi:PhoH-like ATPase